VSAGSISLAQCAELGRSFTLLARGSHQLLGPMTVRDPSRSQTRLVAIPKADGCGRQLHDAALASRIQLSPAKAGDHEFRIIARPSIAQDV
jgi:hypothetical protein